MSWPYAWRDSWRNWKQNWIRLLACRISLLKHQQTIVMESWIGKSWLLNSSIFTLVLLSPSCHRPYIYHRIVSDFQIGKMAEICNSICYISLSLFLSLWLWNSLCLCRRSRCYLLIVIHIFFGAETWVISYSSSTIQPLLLFKKNHSRMKNVTVTNSYGDLYCTPRSTFDRVTIRRSCMQLCRFYT